MNQIHIEDKAVETALAISRLRRGKDLSDTYKDHPFHQGMIEKEMPLIVAEQDIDSEDGEEKTKANLTPTHTSLMCLILKHLIAPKPK